MVASGQGSPGKEGSPAVNPTMSQAEYDKMKGGLGVPDTSSSLKTSYEWKSPETPAARSERIAQIIAEAKVGIGYSKRAYEFEKQRNLKLKPGDELRSEGQDFKVLNVRVYGKDSKIGIRGYSASLDLIKPKGNTVHSAYVTDSGELTIPSSLGRFGRVDKEYIAKALKGKRTKA